MSDTDDSARGGEVTSAPWGSAEVHAGAGLVHRGEDVLLVVPSLGVGQADRAAELLRACVRAGDPTGRRRVAQLAWMVAESEPDALPGFAVLLSGGGSLKVMVYGDVRVTVRGTEDVAFSGTDSLAWVERTVGTPFDTLTIEQTGSSSTQARAALPFDLLAGTVPGSGITLHRAPASPAQVHPEPSADAQAEVQEPARPVVAPAQVEAAQPAVAPSAMSAPAPDAPEGDSIGLTVIRPVADFRSVLLTRGGGPSRSGGRPPLPREADSPTTSAKGGPDVVTVEGRLCPDGHFNDPDSSTCAACSAPIDRGGERVSQPRPPLGCLITDDGRVYTVAGDYVIGREPGQAPAVKSGKAQPLVLQDAEHSTSRIHAHVRVSGWKTLVSDGGSSNGTFISRSGPAGPWTAVPQEPGTVLSAGDRVRLGKRQLLFDRYRESHAL